MVWEPTQLWLTEFIRSSHPMPANEWRDPDRVLETSQNSALITSVGENVKPTRVQIDGELMECISDEPIDTKRGKHDRKPKKTTICSVTLQCFSAASLLSPPEQAYLALLCGDGCFEKITLKDIDNCKFLKAMAREPVTTIWDAWLAFFNKRTFAWKKRLHREGAVC